MMMMTSKRLKTLVLPQYAKKKFADSLCELIDWDGYAFNLSQFKHTSTEQSEQSEQ